MNKQEMVKSKVNGFLGLVGKYKSVRLGLVFLMLCLGIFIISASKISFFGINIERDLSDHIIEGDGHEHYDRDTLGYWDSKD